ncbi:MAG: bifunctional precorrin-2 dehydrogenase/sirohydrochlorin ferrochelatase [Magnetococcales bacterium]|nr:bifunctional precorrin-2 dehydrogenase/sirohydrochlorin ferrochelatase [Magnetococcales bacterium]MBF0420004.1 bifunctional precorrin-2 dehydrogenase/sirohydrochlorin ferrochelatase [Magnetococcales bacterium]MBF0436015.1 bifunctional precorrin-2 dehydrogenase/sirohydrochlorin ferrochelatase [Magnetococcales bacterium]
MQHYMAELNLLGQLVWVIGGGAVALRKVRGLLDTGARIVVVAPAWDPELTRWRDQGCLHIHQGEFSEADLDREPRPMLVFAATGDGGLNQEIAACCRQRRMWCNSADNPEVSGFLVPAVVRRGDMTVAVGTRGASPALSRLLKERLDHDLEPGWQGLVAVFGAMRAEVVRRIPNRLHRQKFWRDTALAAEVQERYRFDEQESWFLARLDAATARDHGS